MVSFDLAATCGAPGQEVFKLLWDPARFPEWWAGMDRVEADQDGQVTRYMAEWPDFAYPTKVTGQSSGVVISCLLSDIVHDWSLAPHRSGCEVRVHVEIPDAEAKRLDAQRAEVGASLARLVSLAEQEAAAMG